MLSELLFTDDLVDLPPPGKDTLRKHANFLRNHCSVPLGHAQEMVAYFYHFSSWSALISRPYSESDVPTMSRMREMRETLQAYRSRMTAQECFKIAELKAVPGTLTAAVERNQIAQLNDYDTILLHRYIYDEEYWGTTAPIDWMKALHKADRCLVLLADRMANSDKKRINPHLYFPWFGLRMYGYLHVVGKTLHYECRELDSYLSPSEDKLPNFFKRPWFVAYITGFVKSLLQTLNQSGYSGRFSVCRVNNEGLIEQALVGFNDKHPMYERHSSHGHSHTDIPINALVGALIAMGGEQCKSPEQIITFNFGRGESY